MKLVITIEVESPNPPDRAATIGDPVRWDLPADRFPIEHWRALADACIAARS